jgi:hypothetical protein
MDYRAARGVGGTGVPVREVVQPACFETGQCVGVALQRHFSEIHHDQFHVLSDSLFGALRVIHFKRRRLDWTHLIVTEDFHGFSQSLQANSGNSVSEIRP